MAITSSHPLKVYVYNDIVLRFCQAKYIDPVVEPEVCAHAVIGFGVKVCGGLGRGLGFGCAVELHDQYI